MLTEAERARRIARMQAWARGGEAGKRRDSERWRAMTATERVDEGLELARIAEKLRSAHTRA